MQKNTYEGAISNKKKNTKWVLFLTNKNQKKTQVAPCITTKNAKITYEGVFPNNSKLQKSKRALFFLTNKNHKKTLLAPFLTTKKRKKTYEGAFSNNSKCNKNTQRAPFLTTKNATKKNTGYRYS